MFTSGNDAAEKAIDFKALPAETIALVALLLSTRDLAHFNAASKYNKQLSNDILLLRKTTVADARRIIDRAIPEVSYHLTDYHTAKLIAEGHPFFMDFFISSSASIQDTWWKDNISNFFAYIQSPEIRTKIESGEITASTIFDLRASQETYLENLLRSYRQLSEDILSKVGLSREEHIECITVVGSLASYRIKDFLKSAATSQFQDFIQAMHWPKEIIKNWLEPIHKLTGSLVSKIWPLDRLTYLLKSMSQSTVQALFTTKALGLDDLNCLALQCIDDKWIDKNQSAAKFLEFVATHTEQLHERGHSIKSIFDSTLASESLESQLELLRSEFAVKATTSETRVVVAHEREAMIAADEMPHSSAQLASIVFNRSVSTADISDSDNPARKCVIM